MIDEVNIMTTLGAGDCGAGRYLVNRIADRVKHARGKHPDWPGRGTFYALEVIKGEVAELEWAVLNESDERIREEALDVVATCCRLINGEHE